MFLDHVHPVLKKQQVICLFFLALFDIFSDQRFSYYKVESISINEYLFGVNYFMICWQWVRYT